MLEENGSKELLNVLVNAFTWHIYAVLHQPLMPRIPLNSVDMHRMHELLI